jgi:hypothetical protein
VGREGREKLQFMKSASKYTVGGSVADPGCLSRIPDPDFYPSRIPDPRTRIQDPKTAMNDRGGKKLVVIPFFHKIELFYF